MADTVSTITLENSPRHLVLKCLGVSDGSGESAIAKVTKASYTGLNGSAPSGFGVERIQYTVTGKGISIKVAHTTPVVIANLSGYGELDYRDVGSISTVGDGTSTGNITFTTIGATSGDMYDITLHLRKLD